MGILFPKNLFGYLAKNSFLTKGVLIFILVSIIGYGLLAPKPAYAGILGDVFDFGLSVISAPLKLADKGLSAVGLNPLDAVTGFVKDLIEGFGKAIVKVLTNLLGAVVLTVVVIISTTIAAFITVVSLLMLQLMEFAMELTFSVSYVSGPIFAAGWTVLRDIANMALIVILVVIAIGTILNFRTNKRLLPIFILVALLVNFTPVFTGLIIDLSNIVAQAFYNSALLAGSAIINANPVGIIGDGFEDILDIWSNLITLNIDFSIIFALLLKSMLVVILSFIVLLTFLFITLLLVGRTFALTFLVILSPIAFVSYILPSTKMIFNRWWKNFIQWSIIIIPLMFFLWLGGIFASNNICSDDIIARLKTVSKDKSGYVVKGQESVFGKSDNPKFFCNATSMLMAVGALVIGGVISMHSSATGSKIITNNARKVVVWGKDWTKREASKKAVQATAGPASALGKRISESSLAQRKYLGGPLRATGRGLKGIMSEQERQRWRDSVKKFRNMTYEELYSDLAGPDMEMAAASLHQVLKNPGDVAKLSKDIENGKISPERLEAFKLWNKTRQTEVGKDFFNTFPHLSDNPYETTSKLSAAQLRKIGAVSFSDPEVIKAIKEGDKETTQLLREIANDLDKIAAYQKGLTEYNIEKGFTPEAPFTTKTRTRRDRNLDAHPVFAANLKAARHETPKEREGHREQERREQEKDKEDKV